MKESAFGKRNFKKKLINKSSFRNVKNEEEIQSKLKTSMSKFHIHIMTEEVCGYT